MFSSKVSIVGYVVGVLLVIAIVNYLMGQGLGVSQKELWTEHFSFPIVRVDDARYVSEDYIEFLRSRPSEIERKRYEIDLIDRVMNSKTSVYVVYKMISVLTRFSLEQNTDTWEANAARVFVGDLSGICKYRKLGESQYELNLLGGDNRCVTGE